MFTKFYTLKYKFYNMVDVNTVLKKSAFGVIISWSGRISVSVCDRRVGCEIWRIGLGSDNRKWAGGHLCVYVRLS